MTCCPRLCPGYQARWWPKQRRGGLGHGKGHGQFAPQNVSAHSTAKLRLRLQTAPQSRSSKASITRSQLSRSGVATMPPVLSKAV